MPKIIIHRGAHTIGGSCIEIRSNDSRILLDAGMPLMENGGKEIDESKLQFPSVENGILPDIKGLYKGDTPEFDAVLISHAHIDHYGLLNHINPEIPVYLSEGSQSLIRTGKVFFPPQSKTFTENFITFEHWKPFQSGNFKITSYLMDHSGYDASGFLIESENKRIFYTGDFRGHGRKAKLLDNMVERPLKNIDCLLMEGTTLGGKHKSVYNSENDVEKGLADIFSNQSDISFFLGSGSNIDRLVSLYNAAKRTNKTLVIDLYTYYVLSQLKKTTHGSKLPPHTDDNIRIYYIKGHADSIVAYLEKQILYNFSHRKIEIDEIMERREEMVIKLPVSVMGTISDHVVKKRPYKNTKFIFSMWKGYMEKNKGCAEFCEKYNAESVHIHVSGHAYLKDLKRFAAAINPKMLVPVHTLAGDNFSEYFSNVHEYNDGELFEV